MDKFHLKIHFLKVLRIVKAQNFIKLCLKWFIWSIIKNLINKFNKLKLIPLDKFTKPLGQDRVWYKV